MRSLVTLGLMAAAVLVLMLTPGLRYSAGGHIAVGVLGMAFFGYYLFRGLRSGTMVAPGAPMSLAGHWRDSPICFWLCTLFNLVWFLLCLALATHMFFEP